MSSMIFYGGTYMHVIYYFLDLRCARVAAAWMTHAASSQAQLAGGRVYDWWGAKGTGATLQCRLDKPSARLGSPISWLIIRERMWQRVRREG